MKIFLFSRKRIFHLWEKGPLQDISIKRNYTEVRKKIKENRKVSNFFGYQGRK
jgi:hypothetical protein